MLKAQFVRLQQCDGKAELVFSAVDRVGAARAAEQMRQWPEVSLTVKKWRNPRSLDANAYMWTLLEKMAEILRSSKDEIYLQMLDSYGKFTHIIVKPEAVEKFTAQWRTVRNLGEVDVKGQKGVQLQCYFGSSTYDTKEMSRLIDGIVSECKELSIDTDTIPFDGSEYNEKHFANG